MGLVKADSTPDTELGILSPIMCLRKSRLRHPIDWCRVLA